MATINNDADTTKTGGSFRFSLAGLVLFSLCLMAGAMAISTWTFSAKSTAPQPAKNGPADPDVQDSLNTRKGPWGELLLQGIELERPIEYISQEVNDPEPETWTIEAHHKDANREGAPGLFAFCPQKRAYIDNITVTSNEK